MNFRKLLKLLPYEVAPVLADAYPRHRSLQLLLSAAVLFTGSSLFFNFLFFFFWIWKQTNKKGRTHAHTVLFNETFFSLKTSKQKCLCGLSLFFSFSSEQFEPVSAFFTDLEKENLLSLFYIVRSVRNCIHKDKKLDKLQAVIFEIIWARNLNLIVYGFWAILAKITRFWYILKPQFSYNVGPTFMC